MPPSDEPYRANLRDSRPAAEAQARGVDSLLVEALIHVLIEKGLLTKNDALSLVETAAQVKRGELDENGVAGVQTAAALRLLKRMYGSFEALDHRPGVVSFDGENVRRLRPPVHGDHPRFPRDD